MNIMGEKRIVKCYNCECDRNIFYAEENGFTLVKCAKCGLLYVNPRPSDKKISRASKTGMHKGKENLNVIGKFNRDKYKRYLKILSKMYPDHFFEEKSSHWLDLGAGHGEFILALQSMIKSKENIEGIDPNLQKRKSAKKKGIVIHDIDYLKINRKYDFISALNVFSHLPDPIKEIRSWRKKLNPSGELLIETGNTAILSAEEHPRPFFLPDHLSFISIDIAENILRKNGFEIIDIQFFRAEHFPIFSFRSFLIELYIVLKNKSFQNRFRFFPNHPNLDMWIRAKKRSRSN